MERTLIKYGLMLFGIVLALLTAYNWAHGRGVAEHKAKTDPIITELKADVKRKEGVIADARTQLEKQRTDHATAIAFLQDSQKQVLSGQKTRLDLAAEKEKLLKGQINALSRDLITVTANSGCVVTAGFVSVHNHAAEGRPLTDRTATLLALSKSGFPSADSPTTVDLSTLGETIAGNYAEARTRGEIIGEWQRWYADSYSAWERAVKLQGLIPLQFPAAP